MIYAALNTLSRLNAASPDTPRPAPSATRITAPASSPTSHPRQARIFASISFPPAQLCDLCSAQYSAPSERGFARYAIASATRITAPAISPTSHPRQARIFACIPFPPIRLYDLCSTQYSVPFERGFARYAKASPQRDPHNRPRQQPHQPSAPSSNFCQHLVPTCPAPQLV